MPKIIMFGDIVEENGKTIRENNQELTHNIPIGSLVELDTGERFYVCKHGRDCDGTPLYSLGREANSIWLCNGFSEESLSTVV